MIKLRTFQIHSPRKRGEGLRVGTVRFLPMLVKKKDLAPLDYFDVWLPTLAPSRKLMQRAKHLLELGKWDDKHWAKFMQHYRHEMETQRDSQQAIELIAQIAKRTPISVGCYCDDEDWCHRSILRALIEKAAK